MKIEIFEEKATEEKVLRLKLVREGDGVKVIAVDALGDLAGAGNLLTFLSNGTIERHRSVSDALGFRLNEFGCIEDVS